MYSTKGSFILGVITTRNVYVVEATGTAIEWTLNRLSGLTDRILGYKRSVSLLRIIGLLVGLFADAHKTRSLERLAVVGITGETGVVVHLWRCVPGLGIRLVHMEESIQLGFEPDLKMLAFIRQKLMGPQGANLKKIQQEAGVRIQLRGKGSGYVDLTPPKSPNRKPMHLYIICESPEKLEYARHLCKELLSSVKGEYDAHISTEYQKQMTAYMTYVQSYYQPQ